MVYSNTDGAVVTYKYRPDGLRYSKTVNGSETVHIWDGANIVGDIGGVAYVRGINLIASKSGSTYTYYLYNGHGDVVQLANSTGIVTKTYDYDAFGNERSPVASDANPFRYCGEYFDKETGTVYLRARYYSPVIGRFTTEDTVRSVSLKLPNGIEVEDALSLNLYTYCADNPILNQDPSGHVFGGDDVIYIWIGGEIVAVATAWLASPAGQRFLQEGGKIIGGLVNAGKNAVGAVVEGIKAAWNGITNLFKGDTSHKSISLPDIKAKLPSTSSPSVYYLAYVNEYGELIKMGNSITYVEALVALGFTGAANTLNQSFQYNKGKSSEAQRLLEHLGSAWGIYTHDQNYAKALAAVFGAESPEVHGSGQYGHYNDPQHVFHVWFGGKLTY